MPDAAPPPAHKRGLRTVAIIEAAKGAAVLLVGFGLLSFLGRDNEQFAERIVQHLHLNPAKHYPQVFISAMASLDDSWLWLLAGLAAFYSLMRFAEAYGLWRERRWAEWLGVLSGGVYVPFEIYKLAQQITSLRVGTLVVNLAIVSYLAWVLVDSRRAASRKPAAYG